MDDFGWAVTIDLASLFTVVVGFGLLFSWFDRGSVRWRMWIMWLTFVSVLWWLIITNAPFTVVT